MKTKVLLILLCVAASIFFMLATSESNNSIVSFASNFIGITSKNLLKNSKFEEGFKDWKKDKDVYLQKTNNINVVYIENKGKGQTRIWQNINVLSGKTYRLSFQLNGAKEGGVAIFRNIRNGKEEYKWCIGDNVNKKYIWDIDIPSTDGFQIYLSTNKQGKFIYSNLSFTEFSQSKHILCFLLSLILISISVYIFVQLREKISFDERESFTSIFDFNNYHCVKNTIKKSLLILVLLFVILAAILRMYYILT